MSRSGCFWCDRPVGRLCPAHLQERAARLDLYWFNARGVLWGVLACFAVIGTSALAQWIAGRWAP